MPNIEIHGLSSTLAHDIRLRIFYTFRNEPYAKEMVVTVFPTKVYDIDGIERPFLRLVNSCQKHSEEIIEKLKKFNMDIEHLKLKAFYLKPKTG
ncbi:hypothetical protein AMJ47_00110 [Parcubacteria bacterium DG_72]|nr:MAG: hypothetical protein AMJ47_00110 [Parcubacteria bacterium DG_72]